MTISYKSTRPGPIHLGMGPFNQTFNRNVRDALNDVGKSVRDRVRQPIKRHPGADSLYNSIKLDRATIKKHSVNVRTESEKAVFRELDMPAHMIFARPKTGGRAVLSFKVRGKQVFATRVKHPGSKGTHSWQYGNLAMKMRLQWGMKYAVDAALSGRSYVTRYS